MDGFAGFVVQVDQLTKEFSLSSRQAAHVIHPIFERNENIIASADSLVKQNSEFPRQSPWWRYLLKLLKGRPFGLRVGR
jgi:hypothetical protein